MVLEPNDASLSLKDKNKTPEDENKAQSQLEWIRAIVGKSAITLLVWLRPLTFQSDYRLGLD